MAYNLVRHSRMTGHEHIARYAEKQMQAFSAQIAHYPAGHSFFLLALQLYFGASQEIVIAEGDNVDTFARMIQHVQQAHLPFAVVIYRGQDQATDLARLAPAHADKAPVKGQTAFYLCQNFACQQPITQADEVAAKLQ
jgi:uncharacterized protein YyaL (SSP411 family)